MLVDNVCSLKDNKLFKHIHGMPFALTLLFLFGYQFWHIHSTPSQTMLVKSKQKVVPLPIFPSKIPNWQLNTLRQLMWSVPLKKTDQIVYNEEDENQLYGQVVRDSVVFLPKQYSIMTV